MTSIRNVTVVSAVHATSSLQERGKARSNFASQHLQAAEYFLKRSNELEREHSGEAAGAFISELNHLVVAVILISVASMEDNINDYIFDNATIIEPFNDKEKKIKEDRSEIIRKYQSAMLALKSELIDRESSIYQDAALLIDMRNALVHFFPEWRDENKRHKDLYRRLRGKFAMCQFPPVSFNFPDSVISYDCARWSIETARKFMEDFTARTGLSTRI